MVRSLLLSVFILAIRMNTASAVVSSMSSAIVNEESDSTEFITFDAIKPVVSLLPPDSGRRRMRYTDESSVLLHHQELLDNTSAETSVSLLAAIETGDEEFSVGMIPVSSATSPFGGRIYNVPIQVASGWSAVPQISLSYNSQSGNNIAGYGWGISGLSSIELRNRNDWYDGESLHSEYDSPDAAYSLDGVPILVSSTEVEGYDHATAKGNILVRKHFTSSGVLSYFTVLFPDGNQGTYGYENNASYRVSYPLTELKDINGNVITFDYILLNNHYHVTRIGYGKDASIEFNYENRPDTGHTSYIGGVSHIFPYRRLSSIISNDGSEEICRYSLSYIFKDGVSLLMEIHCASGESSYRPLTFTYAADRIYNENEVFERTETVRLPQYFIQTDDVDILYKRGRFISDESGEGSLMLPNYPNYMKVNSGLMFHKYDSGYDPLQSILLIPSFAGNPSSIELLAGYGFQTIEAVDTDGDGTDELVKVNNTCTARNVTSFTIEVCTVEHDEIVGTGQLEFNVHDGTHNLLYNNPAQCDYYFGDFRGNGREMLLIVTRPGSHFVLVDLDARTVSESTLFAVDNDTPRWIFIADLENDGQDDICHITSSGMEVYGLSSDTDTAFSKRKTYSGISRSALCNDPSGMASGSNAHLFPVDINGDGYCDIVSAPELSDVEETGTQGSATWNISVFTGKKFITNTRTLCMRYEDDKIDFMDVDDDGLTDMLLQQDSKLYLVRNVGGSFQQQSSYVNIQLDEKSELIPCDYSWYGGRHGDLLVASGGIVNVYEFSVSHQDNRLLTNMLDSFRTYHTNSYGNVSRYDGSYLTDPARIYDRDKGYMRRSFPLSVLKESYVVSDTYATVHEVYTYYDAAFNNLGLGFCGFGKIRCIDYIRDMVTVSENDPERMGVPVSIAKSLLNSIDSPFETLVNTYDGNTSSYGRPDPRLTMSVVTDSLTGLTTTTAISYGIYDFPSSTTVRRMLADGKEHTETVSDTYEHHTVGDKYVLGVIKERSVVRNGGEDASFLSWKQKSVMTYDDFCRPLSRKDYVGYFGLRNNPIHPGISQPDTLNTIHPVLPPIIPPLYAHDATNLVSETRWEYDTYGNVVSEMSAPYGVSTYTGNTFVYDDDGRYIMSATDPLGHTTTYSCYNKFGKPVTETDHKGRVTSYTYDDWGNLTETEYPDGTTSSTAVSWGGEGLYTVLSELSGSPDSIIHYDTSGREVRSGVRRFDGQWQYVDKVYDEKGMLIKESMPFRGSEATYWNEVTYDDFCRRTRLTEASGRQSIWIYDGPEVTSVRNEIASVRTYDASGNLISVADEGGTVTYSLRDDGQPLSVTLSNGVVTTFDYDDYGRRTEIVDPSAGTQTYSTEYNDDGSSVTTHTNPNGTVITYNDRFGRRTKVERPGEYTTDYIYDSDGLLVSETSSNGTSKSYTYDAYDRVLTLTETVPDGKWLKKTFTYGTDGNVTRVAYVSQNGPITIETMTYSWGTLIRRSLHNGANVFQLNSENDMGQPTSVTTCNIPRTYEYTQYGMPARRTLGNRMNVAYIFDPSRGNLLSRMNYPRNQIESFSYDGLNRLTSINDREIVYSDNGNIVNIEGVGQLFYSNADKPYQVTSMLMEEHAAPSGVQTVSYTCYSRPSLITEEGISAAFTYNGDGDRVKMNVASGTDSILSRYYIGGQYELDVTESGTVERLYLGGDAYSAPAVFIKSDCIPSGLYNIGRDYLGSILYILSPEGALVEENSYDPWGRLRNPETSEIYARGAEPSLFLGRGFTGHEHLPWFGLINMNARLYDPLLGRFLSPDPFVQMPDFTQNFNRYSYCLNNPLVYVDENGELVFTTAIIVGICVSAAIGVAIGVYEGYKIAEKKGLEGSARVWTMIGGGLIGGVAGGASAFVGAYVGAGMAVAGIGGFYAGAITGGAAGATAGFINGFGMSTLETGNPIYGLKQGVYQAGIGCLSGALMGGLIQGTSSAIKGNDFWDGSSNLSHRSSSSNILEYDLEPDPTGGNETLYRGTTGSENSYGELYMTDNYEYASSYVRNGGNVAKIQIPKSTLELMQYNGDLCIKRGINATWSNVPYNEYVFSPKVKASIVIRLKF